MILGQQCWVFCLFVRWFEDIRALSLSLLDHKIPLA